MEELFNILTNIQSCDDTAVYKDAISRNLENMAKSWPSNRAFSLCKKQLLRLLKHWNLKVDFSSKHQTNNTVKNQNGENGENEENIDGKKKKKKKKQKSQEKLKEAKEWKMKIARAQEDADIPSFAALVQDNLNVNETDISKDEVSSLKRKIKNETNFDETKKSKKLKKKNKS